MFCLSGSLPEVKFRHAHPAGNYRRVCWNVTGAFSKESEQKGHLCHYFKVELLPGPTHGEVPSLRSSRRLPKQDQSKWVSHRCPPLHYSRHTYSMVQVLGCTWYWYVLLRLGQRPRPPASSPPKTLSSSQISFLQQQ